MNSISKKKGTASNLIAMPFSETLTPTSYELPADLSADEWLDAGRALGRVRATTMWWIGDWWAYGEHAYGDRAGAVKADDWEGPPFQTCMDAAWVCRRFETSSRDEVLSFRTHRAMASIPDDEWRLKILAWAATPGANGKRPTIIAIEDRVKEVRAIFSQGWTPDQLARKASAEAGECVVANMRDDGSGRDRRVDEALLAWAEAESRFVRVDRKTDWGNPFEMPGDGDRALVVGKFSKFYLPHKPRLLADTPGLAGMVLGCWCHPEECHAHVIAEVCNRARAGDGTAEEVADQIAEVDG